MRPQDYGQSAPLTSLIFISDTEQINYILPFYTIKLITWEGRVCVCEGLSVLVGIPRRDSPSRVTDTFVS